MILSFLFILVILLIGINTHNSFAIEYSSGEIKDTCKFNYKDNNNEVNNKCSIDIGYDIPDIGHDIPLLDKINSEKYIANPIMEIKNQSFEISNDSTSKPLISSVNNLEYDNEQFWKFDIPYDSIQKFDNVGEPTFGSNGSLVFYAGNHFAGRIVDGEKWEMTDPNFDFKAEVSDDEIIVPIFKADQHIEYDPKNKIYLWIRQSVELEFFGDAANVDRLAISKDTQNWTVFDILTSDILSPYSISDAKFDYPSTTTTDKYFYLTTTVYDKSPGSSDKKYGLIIRFNLEELADSTKESNNETNFIKYESFLDRDVGQIIVVEGSTNPTYFGAQSDNNSIKLYMWRDDQPYPINKTIPIKPWISIKDEEKCLSVPDSWWCNMLTNTDSRILTAWKNNNTISFMWNALNSNEIGKPWLPYVESASFQILEQEIMYERKYYIAEKNKVWVFAAASSDIYGNVASVSYYFDMDKPNPLASPYFNVAFGEFDNINNKWNMTPLENSTHPLPVLNERGEIDYNFGDFFTIKPHLSDTKYRWEIGVYTIIGDNYYDIKPMFIMKK